MWNISEGPCAVSGMAAIASQSTGSALGDGAIGALAGYFLAPPSQRLIFTLGGAAVTAGLGLLGLGLTTGFALLRR